MTNRYQSPESIRDETFQRRMLGLDADRVYEYLDLLADQLQAMEHELGVSRAENARLQAELDQYEQVGDRVNEQVIQLFSQAQLVAEEMVKDVSRDAQERIGQARAHERRIVEEAMDTAGEHVRSYARTAQAHMQSVVDAFATEVDRLGSTPPGESARHQKELAFDDPGDWQLGSRNGSGPDSSMR